MVLKIEIKGEKEVMKYVLNLPKRLDSALTQTNDQFVRDVKRSAKLRVRRDTSKTAKSIDIKKTKTRGKSKQWKIVVGSRAGFYQELGFKPHWIFVTQNKTINNSNERTKKLSPGFHFVKKSKPFLIPAYDSQIQKLDQKLSQGTTKALK